MSYIKLPRLNTQKPNIKYDTKNLQDLIEDKKDETIIYEAINIGYLLYPSKELIWKTYEQQTDFDLKSSQKLIKKLKYYHDDEFENDFLSIVYLNLSKVPLLEIGDLFICQNLTILNLSNNFLVTIEPLIECVNLLRLDLQNNQITKLPDIDFWSGMTKLRFLFLHNNPIAKLEYLKYLSFCPCLEILTLYDSPISLKHNYRHHTVNSIVSLKALDKHVISDEEIIEEAKFNNKFSALTSNFRVNLNIPQAVENSFKSELHVTKELMKKVNKILSKNSPVLIIQRNLRGYLCRKQFRKIRKDKKLNAIILIQYWWRKQRKLRLNKKTRLMTDEQTDIQNTHATSSFSTDYKNRPKDNKRNNTPTSMNMKRNIIIDLNKLNKLQASFYDISQGQMESPRHDLPNIPSKPQSSDHAKARSKKDDYLLNLFRDKKVDPNKLITISKMIANFNETFDSDHLARDFNYDYLSVILREFLKKNLKDKSLNSRSELGSDDPNLMQESDESNSNSNTNNFRLPILEPDNSIIKSKDNYIVDLVKEKFIGFNSIKKMENEAHKKMYELKNSVKTHQHEILTNDQRFFQKIYGNMSLGSLKAVDKAYEERNTIDKSLAKQKKIEGLKEFKKYSHQQVDYFREDRIKEVQDAFIKEKNLQQRAKLTSDKEMLELKEKVKEQKERLIAFKKKRRRDILIAIDFSKQHLSVSKALQRHEYLTGKDNKLRKNTDFILNQKYDQEKQHEIVKRYIQQRNMLRLMQANNEKKLVEDRIKEERVSEDLEAKRRVQYLRSYESKQVEPVKMYYFDFQPNDVVYGEDEYNEDYFVGKNFVLDNNEPSTKQRSVLQLTQKDE